MLAEPQQACKLALKGITPAIFLIFQAAQFWGALGGPLLGIPLMSPLCRELHSLSSEYLETLLFITDPPASLDDHGGGRYCMIKAIAACCNAMLVPPGYFLSSTRKFIAFVGLAPAQSTKVAYLALT